MIKLKMRHLQALQILARAGSFTQAAAQLHTTQSNLSLTIREAEDLLGVKLFERTTRHCRPTSMGEEFLPIVERVLADLQKGIANLQANTRLTQGVLAVGAASFTTTVLVAGLLDTYARAHPGVAIRIEDHGIPEQLLKLLRSETIELLIGTYAEHDADLKRLPLLDIPLVLYAHRSLGLPPTVSWTALKHMPMVAVARRSSVVRQLIDKVFWDVHGAVYCPDLECNHWSSVMALTEIRQAACIVPMYGSYGQHYPELECRTLVEPVVSRRLHVAHLKHREPSPAAQAFIEQLRRDGRFLLN